MRIAPARWSRRGGDPPRTGRRVRLEEGERVEATLTRWLAGPLAVLEIRGTRLVAWMDRRVHGDQTLYLEVVSTAPVLRLRRLTGGAAFWTLPVGRSRSDQLNLRA